MAAVLARAALIHPAGFVWLDPAALSPRPRSSASAALAALLATAGGAAYPPRLERLERLYKQVPDGLGGGRTLGGCRLLRRRARLLLCREPAALAPPVPAPPGGEVTGMEGLASYLPAAAPQGCAWAGWAGSGWAPRLAGCRRRYGPACRRSATSARWRWCRRWAMIREGFEAGWLAGARLCL